VFCGVLWCFAVFCVGVFSIFHKTDQNRPKNIQNAQNEQNTLCAIQRNTVLCVFLSLRKCLQKTFAKHVQNIAKQSQNTAKHRKTLFFKKHSQNTTKHPQNTRKTPQNTAKHHKTDLLIKQTKLANKLLRSQACTESRPTSYATWPRPRPLLCRPMSPAVRTRCSSAQPAPACTPSGGAAPPPSPLALCLLNCRAHSSVLRRMSSSRPRTDRSARNAVASDKGSLFSSLLVIVGVKIDALCRSPPHQALLGENNKCWFIIF